MKQIMIAALAVLMLTACGNKTNNGGWFSADSTATNAGDKHSAEYITLRLDTIYSLRDDSLCCSEHYLELYAEAEKVSRRDGTLFMDANHWTMSNDMPEDWSYSVTDVTHITDSTAQVSVVIHSFDEQNVMLDLVFERDNWYVDNFRSLYEGADYDAAGNKIPGTEGTKEYNELKALQEFIQQKPDQEIDVDESDLQTIPRRNSLEEAERMTEAAKERLEEYAE